MKTKSTAGTCLVVSFVCASSNITRLTWTDNWLSLSLGEASARQPPFAGGRGTKTSIFEGRPFPRRGLPSAQHQLSAVPTICKTDMKLDWKDARRKFVIHQHNKTWASPSRPSHLNLDRARRKLENCVCTRPHCAPLTPTTPSAQRRPACCTRAEIASFSIRTT